jgi:hypothetical protein
MFTRGEKPRTNTNYRRAQHNSRIGAYILDSLFTAQLDPGYMGQLRYLRRAPAGKGRTCRGICGISCFGLEGLMQVLSDEFAR